MKDDLTKELEQYYTNGRPNSKQQHKSFSGNIFVISNFIVVLTFVVLLLMVCVWVRFTTSVTKNDISTEWALDNTSQIIDNKMVDLVEYANLEPAKTYTLAVKIINRDTDEIVAEQSRQFTPTHESGTTEFEYDTSSLPEHIWRQYRITKIED